MPRLDLRAFLGIAAVLVLVGVTSQATTFGTGAGRVTNVYDDASCGDVRDVPDEDRVSTMGGQVLCLLNFERKRHGLPPLRANGLLELIATGHSADMVARRFFDHVSPDGIDPEGRARVAGWRAGIGENIAWGTEGQGSPAAIVNGWMHSPGHRANILKPEYREIGIGISVGDGPSELRARRVAGTYTTNFGF
jgi:uncharacterized protein YkwD